MPLCDDYNNGECLGVENGQNGDYASEVVGECECEGDPPAAAEFDFSAAKKSYFP